MQSSVPPLLNVPSGQSTGACVGLGHLWPAGQLLHVVALTISLYEPLTHSI